MNLMKALNTPTKTFWYFKYKDGKRVRVPATVLEATLPHIALVGFIMFLVGLSGAEANPWWAGPCFIGGFLGGVFGLSEAVRRGIFP